MKKLKAAIIGCGRIAPSHISALKENPQKYELVALCDLDTAKAQALIKKYDLQNVAVYDDYRTMLDSSEIDLCAVCTYSGNHDTVAEYIINKKIHTLIEKPVSLSVDRARFLQTLAAQNGVTLGVCFQNRFNKAFRCLADAISKGRLGRIMYATTEVRWHRDKDYYDSDDWRGTWAFDGGALFNQCIHAIDLLIATLGTPTEVFSYTDNLHHPYIEVEDLGLILIKFQNGTYGMVEGSVNTEPGDMEETLSVFGTDGTVKLGGMSINTIDYWCLADGNETLDEVKEKYTEISDNVYGQGHKAVYSNLYAVITEGSEPVAPFEAGITATEVILAAYKSSAEGKPIKLPLTDCKTVDFEGRFKKQSPKIN